MTVPNEQSESASRRSVSELSLSLQQSVSDLANLERTQRELDRLAAVQADLDRAVRNLTRFAEKLVQVRECGFDVSVVYPGNPDADLGAIAKSDFGHAEVSRFLVKVNQFGSELDEGIRAGWRRHVDTLVPDLNGQEALAKALQRVGGPTKRAAQDLLHEVTSLRAVVDSSFSPLNFKAISDGSAKVNTLASELAPVPAVREFVLAMTAGGAPLASYLDDPEVQAWISENDLTDSLRVVAR